MSDLLVFVPLAFVAVALIFWAWMFRDLWTNAEIPVNFASGLSWPPESKNAWPVAFIVLTVFGAYFYYAGVYRNRR
jgi:hypothetical protein